MNKNQNEQAESVELAKLFEVEELEERIEFGKWSGEVKGGASESKGAYVEAGIKFTF